MIHELSNKCLFRPNLLFNIFLSKLQTLCCNGYQRCDDSRNVRVCFAKCLAMITICFLPVG